jgi:hypothetical protein
VFFKHLIGKSTLKEGITIHKAFESFFDSPESGQKREITLHYGNNQSTTVTLRRLNNIRQHVHIKYTNKLHTSFIDWLNDIFIASRNGTVGEFLEFQKVSPDIYNLRPITIDKAYNAKLYIADAMYHKTDNEMLKNNALFDEVGRIINGLNFKVDESQAFYNFEIKKAFSYLSWEKEGKAIPELDLKYDFRKNGIQVEVEFGNARAYYQDYIKFMLSYFAGQIHLGMLITPTIGFANILCEIGKQKALQKGRKSYSGMMHFEKAHKEFLYIKQMFDMPIVILGIDINPR